MFEITNTPAGFEAVSSDNRAAILSNSGRSSFRFQKGSVVLVSDLLYTRQTPKYTADHKQAVGEDGKPIFNHIPYVVCSVDGRRVFVPLSAFRQKPADTVAFEEEHPSMKSFFASTSDDFLWDLVTLHKVTVDDLATAEVINWLAPKDPTTGLRPLKVAPIPVFSEPVLLSDAEKDELAKVLKG